MIKNVNNPNSTPASAASRTAGSQTLARGLEVLRLVASMPEGIGVNEVAEQAGIHRTGAYRLLNTLCDARLLHRGSDGRYRGAMGLLSLSASAYSSLLAVAEPVLRRCADELGATVALIVREENEAIALRVSAPSSGTYHVSFTEASRHPLNLGAAGHAILASAPPLIGEDPRVTDARTKGYAQTFGEVEPGMYGLAVPLDQEIVGIPACLNLITVREDQALSSVGLLRQTARTLESLLS